MGGAEWGSRGANGILSVLPRPRAVVVRKRKLDGSIRFTWNGDLIATAGQRWLVVHHEAGRHQRHHATHGETVELPAHALHWLGRDVPLTVLSIHDDHGHFIRAKCDAALPAVEAPGVIDFVDLDVDLLVSADGAQTIADEAVYARNVDLLGYDAETDAAVAAGMSLARTLIERHDLPFDGSGERLLTRLITPRATVNDVPGDHS
jgi:protein associated with RNAse G/E